MTPNPNKWHSGPPPHVGWWQASFFQTRSCWRWWNGKAWSKATFEQSSMDVVIENAMQASIVSNIQWTHYYPEGARVPRIKP